MDLQNCLLVEDFCEKQGWGSDGKWVEFQGTRDGERCVDPGVAVFGIDPMGVLLLLSTWNKRNEQI